MMLSFGENNRNLLVGLGERHLVLFAVGERVGGNREM